MKSFLLAYPGNVLWQWRITSWQDYHFSWATNEERALELIFFLAVVFSSQYGHLPSSFHISYWDPYAHKTVPAELWEEVLHQIKILERQDDRVGILVLPWVGILTSSFRTFWVSLVETAKEFLLKQIAILGDVVFICRHPKAMIVRPLLSRVSTEQKGKN